MTTTAYPGALGFVPGYGCLAGGEPLAALRKGSAA
jgi:hypothetical protein